MMYHVAPIVVRKAIENEGMKPGADCRFPHLGDYPPGLYLFERLMSAYEWIDRMILYYDDPGVDLWQVETDGLDLHPDLVIGEGAFYTLEPIPSNRLTRLGEYLVPEDEDDDEEDSWDD